MNRIGILLAIFIFSLVLVIPNVKAEIKYYYLGRWVWNNTEPNSQFWQAPFSNKIIGTIDLRSIPQQSIAGGTPQGFGLFAYNSPLSPQEIITSNSFFIGANNSIIIPIIKAGIQNRLNITLNETTLENVIFELLTLGGDPTGQQRWKPLIPAKTTLEVFIGGSTIKSKVVSDWLSTREWNNIKLTLQEDFKTIWNESNITARKMLTTWMEKYKVNYSEFLPAGFENVTPLPHSTTVTDNFNRADATTLGASWSVLEEQVAGDGWRISANRAIVAASGGFSVNRYDTNLASSDHYAQINMQFVSLGRDQGPLIRKDGSTALTYYLARAVHSADTWNTYKRVNGTLTSIGTNAGPKPTVGDTLKINASGSTITRWVNGTLNDTATDTAVTVGLRTGIQTSNGETRVDDFEAADLAVAASNSANVTISLSLTANTQKTFAASRLPVQALDITESDTSQQKLTRPFTQSGTLSEKLSKSAKFLKNPIQSISLTERVLRILTFLRSLTNSLSLTEKIQVNIKKILSISQSFNISNNMQRTLSLTRNFLLNIISTIKSIRVGETPAPTQESGASPSTGILPTQTQPVKLSISSPRIIFGLFILATSTYEVMRLKFKNKFSKYYLNRTNTYTEIISILILLIILLPSEVFINLNLIL